MSLLFLSKNNPLSMYSMKNNSNRLPELKDFGLWMTIYPVLIGELLCLDSVDFVIPLLFHYFSNISGNTMKINRKRTGAMMSP